MAVVHSSHPFCANPDCQLHVRAGDDGVKGFGNWAVMPDGRTVGRSRYYGLLLCDVCGHALLAHPIDDGHAVAFSQPVGSARAAPSR